MPDDLDTTWHRVRQELRSEVADLAFHVWLDPLELVGREGGALFVKAPAHVRTWVAERYLPLLERSARRTLGETARVELVEHRAYARNSTPPALGTETDSPEHDSLNPKYTFGQFVIGDGNRFAHAAALAVAELPAQAYNPLFVYGHPGLGKTHLLHAIGNYIRHYAGGLRVRYTTIESFTGEFVQAVRTKQPLPFKQRFREADVLLLDDAHFLEDKARTGEELFHTFNALYESGRQLVVTSDREPAQMDEIEARLRERFAAGLVAEIKPPDIDVRLAILQKRVRLDGLDTVADETLTAIAERVTTSIRALEGALIRVIAYASLTGEEPTPALAHTVLSHLCPKAPPRPPTTAEVSETTAQAFGLSPETLLAQDRRPQVAFARQVAMYLARELTHETLPAIGRQFGGRNHTTVLHAQRKIATAMQQDAATLKTVDNLRKLLAGET